MIAMAEEKVKKDAASNKEELEYKIEIATQTLERNIGFIANCDNLRLLGGGSSGVAKSTGTRGKDGKSS